MSHTLFWAPGDNSEHHRYSSGELHWGAYGRKRRADIKPVMLKGRSVPERGLWRVDGKGV